MPKQNCNHPFEGGTPKKGITKKHVPLIWENMLGTVNAKDPLAYGKEAEYFDFDWDKAREYARVSQCSDLRIARVDRAFGYNYGPRRKQLALWGIPSEVKK